MGVDVRRLIWYTIGRAYESATYRLARLRQAQWQQWPADWSGAGRGNRRREGHGRQPRDLAQLYVHSEINLLSSNKSLTRTANMVSLPAAGGANGVGSTDVIGVFNVLNTAGGTLYNTMAKITVTANVPDGQVLPAARLVPQLFTQAENLYGTYAVMAGPTDNYLYLFARNAGSGAGPSSLKVARVPQPAVTDKTQYQYWDGATWSAAQPAVSDTRSDIITSQGFMDTGEIFWSNHFGCFVHVTASYGDFQIAYSESVTGGWSAPQELYKATMPSSLQGSQSSLIYAGHAYPDWDVTGKSLLLSWTAAEEWIQMATVQFAWGRRVGGVGGLVLMIPPVSLDWSMCRSLWWHSLCGFGIQSGRLLIIL